MNNNEVRNNDNQTNFNEIEKLLEIHKKNIKNKMIKMIYRYFNTDDDVEKTIFDIIEYSTSLNEKYYRSLIIKSIGDILEIEQNKSTFIGILIEFLNNYIEMQTSMPDIDNNDLKENKITCHKKFGNGKTMIASNALISMIFETILSNKILDINKEKKCEIIEIINKHIGKNGICNGQMLKLILKKRQTYQDEITRMHKMKVISLYEAGIECMEVIKNILPKQKKSINLYINNFCNLMDVYGKISKNKDDLELLLSQSDLLKKQAIDSLKNFENNKKKQLLDLIEYLYNNIQNTIKQKTLTKPIIIQSDLNESRL